MSFKQLLYFAAIVVGAVAVGMWAGEPWIGAYLISGVVIILTTLLFWASKRPDFTTELLKAVLFIFGLVAEISVWHWVLPLVLVTVFGVFFLSWYFED